MDKIHVRPITEFSRRRAAESAGPAARNLAQGSCLFGQQRRRSLGVMKTLLPALLIASATLVSAADKWENWFANGKLDGFQIVSGTASYKVENGVLVGTTVEGSGNTFLATAKPSKDF